MRGLVILGNGFEDTEAIATIDVLKRAKLDLDLISMSHSLDVVSQTGINVKADKIVAEVNIDHYDFLVIPGGKAVFEVLDKSELLTEIILGFARKKQLIAAICAGPTQVGKLGLYEGNTFTCFPTTEKHIIKGIHKNKGVVVSNNFISAKAMGYSIDFGLAIVEYLLGKESKEKVKKAVFGEV